MEVSMKSVGLIICTLFLLISLNSIVLAGEGCRIIRYDEKKIELICRDGSYGFPTKSFVSFNKKEKKMTFIVDGEKRFFYLK